MYFSIASCKCVSTSSRISTLKKSHVMIHIVPSETLILAVVSNYQE